MVVKWQEVNVLIRYLWKCKICGNSHGFTAKKENKRFAFCVYCDQGTQQVADV